MRKKDTDIGRVVDDTWGKVKNNMGKTKDGEAEKDLNTIRDINTI